MRYANLIPLDAGANAQPWVIADDGLGRGAGSKFLVEMLPAFTQAVQLGAYFEADFQEPINRFNRAVEFSITVEHEFATPDECFLFLSRLPLDCPNEGLLQVGVVGGAEFSYNAVIKGVATTASLDVSVTLVYQVSATPATN